MISIQHEFIRHEYYDQIQILFKNYILQIENKIKLNIGRIFGCFLSTLYFFETDQIDDVIIEIKNFKAFVTIEQNLLYNKIILKKQIIKMKKTIEFIDKWNKLTQKFMTKLNNKQIEILVINYSDNKLEYNNNIITIHPNVYLKLSNTLKKNNSIINNEVINNFIYILCYRYKYFGMYDNNGQLALNVEYKKMLENKYKIDTELFASPINFYFPNYYSLFPHLEKYFGSKGRFSSIDTLEAKYYFSNPPFEDEILFQASLKYILLMKKCNSHFITTIPIWGKIKYTPNSDPNNYIDYSALYTLIPFIDKIKIYGKNQLEYFNYTTQRKVFVSDTYLIYISNK